MENTCFKERKDLTIILACFIMDGCNSKPNNHEQKRSIFFYTGVYARGYQPKIISSLLSTKIHREALPYLIVFVLAESLMNSAGSLTVNETAIYIKRFLSFVEK